mmetsp:Transcript_812/g.2501  ORF Transcript_812/g.2501 Transcript_812/m.2501 type:complete len:363 (+) Transcript_812:1196-2284(+)
MSARNSSATSVIRVVGVALASRRASSRAAMSRIALMIYIAPSRVFLRHNTSSMATVRGSSSKGLKTTLGEFEFETTRSSHPSPTSTLGVIKSISLSIRITAALSVGISASTPTASGLASAAMRAMASAFGPNAKKSGANAQCAKISAKWCASARLTCDDDDADDASSPRAASANSSASRSRASSIRALEITKESLPSARYMSGGKNFMEKNADARVPLDTCSSDDADANAAERASRSSPSTLSSSSSSPQLPHSSLATSDAPSSTSLTSTLVTALSPSSPSTPSTLASPPPASARVHVAVSAATVHACASASPPSHPTNTTTRDARARARATRSTSSAHRASARPKHITTGASSHTRAPSNP